MNDPPVANNVTKSTQEDVPLVFSLDTPQAALDVDINNPGDTLTYTLETTSLDGTVTITANTVTFTPTLNFNGVTSFVYRVTDSAGEFDTATVTVTVDPVRIRVGPVLLGRRAVGAGQ